MGTGDQRWRDNTVYDYKLFSFPIEDNTETHFGANEFSLPVYVTSRDQILWQPQRHKLFGHVFFYLYYLLELNNFFLIAQLFSNVPNLTSEDLTVQVHDQFAYQLFAFGNVASQVYLIALS